MEKFKSKLSTTRAGERSRIWIQGKRLAAAGFKPGAAYGAIWKGATLVLNVGSDAPIAPTDHVESRKVSGKGELPIIDIVGERVIETFGKHGTHVSVTYGDGVITIRRAG